MSGAFAAGRILNPKTARSQVIGAMTMGLGAALMEEAIVDTRHGYFVNHDLAEYHVPVHADVPLQDVFFLDEVDDKSSPMKAKGVGELGLCGSAAAIANAVYNASGVAGSATIRSRSTRSCVRWRSVRRAAQGGSGVGRAVPARSKGGGRDLELREAPRHAADEVLRDMRQHALRRHQDPTCSLFSAGSSNGRHSRLPCGVASPSRADLEEWGPDPQPVQTQRPAGR